MRIEQLLWKVGKSVIVKKNNMVANATKNITFYFRLITWRFIRAYITKKENSHMKTSNCCNKLEGRLRNRVILHILIEAIKNNQFEIYFQPIYSISASKFITAEALVRLFDFEFGSISPAEFIPIAEKNGLIYEIGLIIFEKICLFMNGCDIQSLGFTQISVNLSIKQCNRPELFDDLVSIMNRYHIDPSFINFEITETVVAESITELESLMNKFMAFGCTFSLDDFGTGYNNISKVTPLPFQTVKLDKKLIWTAENCRRTTIGIKHLIQMFKELNMSTVAEGVETKEQLQMMIDLGVDHIQGYYYSKPMSAQELLACKQSQN